MRARRAVRPLGEFHTAPRTQFRFSNFAVRVYDMSMAEHIEDIQHRYVDLKKRMELVRSYL